MKQEVKLKKLIKDINNITTHIDLLEYNQKLELSIAITKLQEELTKQMVTKKNIYNPSQLVWFYRDGVTERVNIQQIRFNDNEWQYQSNNGIWYSESEAVDASTQTYANCQFKDDTYTNSENKSGTHPATPEELEKVYALRDAFPKFTNSNRYFVKGKGTDIINWYLHGWVDINQVEDSYYILNVDTLNWEDRSSK